MNTEPIPFSIDRWQELVVEKATHTLYLSFQDANCKARIICTDRIDHQSIVVLFIHPESEKEDIWFLTKEDASKRLTIAPNPPKSLGWYGLQYHSLCGPYESRDHLLKELPYAKSIHEFFEGEGLT